jgi:hypothetical protein
MTSGILHDEGKTLFRCHFFKCSMVQSRWRRLSWERYRFSLQESLMGRSGPGQPTYRRHRASHRRHIHIHVDDHNHPAQRGRVGNNRPYRRAKPRCLSAANLKPRPNSALSSNSEFDQAGPRPSLFLVHGVTGRFPP